MGRIRMPREIQLRDENTMIRILDTGPVSHHVMGEGPYPLMQASVARQATIATEDGRERIVRIVAYGASRNLLGAKTVRQAA